MRPELDLVWDWLQSLENTPSEAQRHRQAWERWQAQRRLAQRRAIIVRCQAELSRIAFWFRIAFLPLPEPAQPLYRRRQACRQQRLTMDRLRRRTPHARLRRRAAHVRRSVWATRTSMQRRLLGSLMRRGGVRVRG